MYSEDLDARSIEEIKKDWEWVHAGTEGSYLVKTTLEALREMDIEEKDIYKRRPSIEDFKSEPMYECLRDKPRELENWVIVFRRKKSSTPP
jgi:AAA+ ATPase superfamily predicted ATPase